ncbi:hypothetical protein K457DRAFT_151338 [Linnemannia elongata AG-77]|uniref:F-box domain-containing protein n=1 Tax=Linnemannia elongata AG-77 TaxID=1314771 RepID=A0A197KGQ8_9FUNG|nr:hypothetical protein K457DRAFT_151338 [Linnemannia elongata AG-77]
MNPALKVFSLPEIVFRISPFLSTPDLFSSIQVCHTFNNALLPALWHTVDTTLNGWPHILTHYDSETSKGDKDEAWIFHVFAKHGHFIQNLTIRSTVLVDAAYFSGTCTNIRKLFIQFSREYWELIEKRIYKHMETENLIEVSTEDPYLSPANERRIKDQQDRNWMSNQYMWLLLQQQTSLQNLNLCTGYTPLAYILSRDFIYETLASFPRLVHYESQSRHLDIGQLVERVPQLQSLITRRGLPGDHLLAHPSPSIRVLFVKLFMKCDNFFGYLRAFPNLEQFSVIGSGAEPVCRDGGTILRNTPSRLKELIFPKRLSYSDNNLALWILPWLPELTRIGSDRLGPLTAKALVTHCKRLQGFHQQNPSKSIYGASVFKEHINVVSELLWGCINLIDIDAPDYRIDVDRTLCFPWKCLGLETLRLKITGVQRLTESEEAILTRLAGDSEPGCSGSRSDISIVPTDKIGDSDETAAATTTTTNTTNLTDEQNRFLAKSRKSQEQHHKIYDQLSCLTRLRVLDIGHVHDWPNVQKDDCSPANPVVHVAPIPDTLELSLKSGLGQLATLTQLEVFGCEYRWGGKKDLHFELVVNVLLLPLNFLRLLVY